MLRASERRTEIYFRVFIIILMHLLDTHLLSMPLVNNVKHILGWLTRVRRVDF